MLICFALLYNYLPPPHLLTRWISFLIHAFIELFNLSGSYCTTFPTIVDFSFYGFLIILFLNSVIFIWPYLQSNYSSLNTLWYPQFSSYGNRTIYPHSWTWLMKSILVFLFILYNFISFDYLFYFVVLVTVYGNPLCGSSLMNPSSLYLWFGARMKFTWHPPTSEIPSHPIFYDAPEGYGWTWWSILGSQQWYYLIYVPIIHMIWDGHTRSYREG